MVTDGDRLRMDWSAETVRGLLPSSLLPAESPEENSRLPPPTSGELRPASGDDGQSLPSVGNEYLPPTEADGDRSGAHLRERLPTTLGNRISSPDIRDRLATPAVRERLSATELGSSVPSAGLGERLPAAGLGDSVSPLGIRDRLAGSTVRERVPSAELERFSPGFEDPTAGLSDRVSVPEFDRNLSGPSVALPDSDSIVGGGDIEARVYDTQTTTPEYFVGVIPADHDTVTGRLADSEFGASRVTYPKTLDDDIDYDESSIWVYRSWALSHFQLHVPMFEVEHGDRPVVYVFYHHEYNWLRHPVNHLDAEYLNPDWERDVIVDLIEAAGLTVKTCAEIDGDDGPAAEYCATCGDNT
jgi:hypothetical protein